MLACTVVWSDTLPTPAPQYPDMAQEVRVAACAEGDTFDITVTRRTVDGPLAPQWLQESKWCWARGERVWCNDYPY